MSNKRITINENMAELLGLRAGKQRSGRLSYTCKLGSEADHLGSHGTLVDGEWLDVFEEGESTRIATMLLVSRTVITEGPFGPMVEMAWNVQPEPQA